MFIEIFQSSPDKHIDIDAPECISHPFCPSFMRYRVILWERMSLNRHYMIVTVVSYEPRCVP